jgi:hypothetical protein
MKMIRAFLLAAAAVVVLCAEADTWTDSKTGITWTYKVSSGKADIIGVNTTTGAIVIPSTIGVYPVVSIGNEVFEKCYSLTSITIPDSVTSIGKYAFMDCDSLTSVTIGESVTVLGYYAFRGCYSLKRVEFKGAPPKGVEDSRILDYGIHTFPREYGSEYQELLASQLKLGGFYHPNKPVVEYVSVKIRENDPTILDCVYRIKSGMSRVKVRALAFEDGVRSFAKVVRPETFIEGTDANIGDAISVNEEHKLSWKVSADWTNTLAKVKFEVLATEEHLLPLELSTIPKTSSHPAMQVSWNVPKEDDVFNALLWLYADGDEGMTLENGVLKDGGNIIAYGEMISVYSERKYTTLSGVYAYYNFGSAVSYAFSKMGFSTLSGDELSYAKRRLRMNLEPSGIRQYAYRNLSDE